MSALAISAMGACAPGLEGWNQLRAVLRGEETHRPQTLAKLTAMSLPATERRRANGMAHLALHVAAEAIRDFPGALVMRLPTIFSSAHGDGHVLAQMLDTLCQSSIALSPTVFHNSVFNAAAGYWSIAGPCQAPSTTVCAGDASFAGGLIEAYTQVCATRSPVLYIAVDMTFPETLHDFDLRHEPFACALLLAPASTDAPVIGGWIDGWSIAHEPGVIAEGTDPLSEFFAGNPAARALPLLSAIALRREARVRLPYLDRACLDLVYTP